MVTNLEFGSGGNRLIIKGINLLYSQISLDRYIVDEIKIFLAVFGNFYLKIRSQMRTDKALGLVDNIGAVRQALRLGTALAVSSQQVSLSILCGIIAARGFQINLELSTLFRFLNNGIVFIGMLHNRYMSLNHLLVADNGQSVFLNRKVVSISSQGMLRLIKQITGGRRDFF